MKGGGFSSKVGLILAAAGSAVGLGNIWKFPYIAGENGGAAFLIVYLLCVLLFGLPLIMTELLIGKRSGKSVSCCPAMVDPDCYYTDLPQ